MTEEMPFISEFKAQNREVILIHSTVLEYLMSHLVTAKSHRHIPAWMKVTTQSLYQHLHTTTLLAFPNGTFPTPPLAVLHLGSERKKEQSKASRRVVAAAGSLGSTKRKLRENSSPIPSDSRTTLNLHYSTNNITSRETSALCLPVMLQVHLWYSDSDRF